MLILQMLRSVMFNGLFWLWTIIVALLSFPLVVGPRIFLVRSLEIWAKGVMLLLKLVVGIAYEVRGQDNIPDTQVIYALKHQSMWDTIMLHLLIDDPAIVLKKELTYIPFYGWIALRIGMIAVDRDNGASALKKMVKAAKQSVARGQSIAIFPEGTRADLDTAPDYKPGVGALYTQIGLPVIPVALNSGLFWGRRSFTKHTGTIIVDILPPISAGMRRRPFMAELEQTIESATEKLVEETRMA